jgi:hypothetical protein
MARKRSKRASKTSAAKGKRKGKARAAPTERRAQPKGMINAWEDDPAAGAQPSGGPVIQSAGSSVRKPLARRGSQSGALKNSSETLSSNANSLCGQNSAGFPEIGATFKGIFCADVSEFESSLSGRVGVKHFQTAPSILVSMPLAGSSLLFGIGTLALP